jgi:hypothetical protein
MKRIINLRQLDYSPDDLALFYCSCSPQSLRKIPGQKKTWRSFSMIGDLVIVCVTVPSIRIIIAVYGVGRIKAAIGSQIGSMYA